MNMEQDDRQTTLAQVKSWVQKFCEARDWDPYHGPKDLAIGVVTEGSELLEIFRFVGEKDLPKMMQDQGVRAQIADELADSLYFILRFAQLYDFDLAQALSQKLEKNEKKYPVEK